MFGLSGEFKDSVSMEGKEIAVNLAFDNVLRAYEVLEGKKRSATENSSATEYEKMPTAARIFEALKCFGIKGSYTISERAFLLEKVLELANEYSLNVDDYNYKKNDGEALVDYKRDAGLIYCAFLQGYGIDLFEMQGKLHWAKFLTLLGNIPDETRLAKVIGYRGMNLPAANSHNRQEVMRIRELKNIYRLDKTPKQVNDRINTALASLFW